MKKRFTGAGFFLYVTALSVTFGATSPYTERFYSFAGIV